MKQLRIPLRGIGIMALVYGLIGGCATATLTSTSTGPRQAARQADCDFKTLTIAPHAGFIEIGTIDFNFTAYDRIDVLSDFAARIRPQVCAAGGNAVVAMKEEHGFYYQATILKEIASGASSSPPTAASEGGCQYDTQCKGARVCVNGRCVDPPQ